MKARVRTTEGQKDVLEYAEELEARRKSKQKQARYCGEGRIGHGTRTRVKDAYTSEDVLSNFRKTINHRYSKNLVEYAAKNGYGVIQMEDLTNIKADLEHPKFLRHWTYYDLQVKIEAKAREHGITVRKIDPAYTSKRCSKCGHIDDRNRQTQERFLCTSCGYSCNADFNASQNISIADIEKIIQKTIGAKPKRTEKP
jgi:IS605 OrfB family transposase